MDMYTEPTGRFPHRGDLLDFKPIKEALARSLRVNVGGAEYVDDELPSRSSGFSSCSALIIKNEQNKEYVLSHVSIPDLWCPQTKEIGSLMKSYLASLNLEVEKIEVLNATIDDLTNMNSLRSMSSDELKSQMTSLNEGGIIHAAYLTGTSSHDISKNITDHVLGYLGIPITDKVHFSSVGYTWSLLYDVKDSKIWVKPESKDEVLIFSF